MENGGIRTTIFLLLGVAGLTALSTLVGSGEPSAANATEELEPFVDEPRLASTSHERSVDIPPPPPHSKPPTAVEAFLRDDHSLRLPAPRPEQHEWTWEDDSVQIAFDGCKPIARDPLVPKIRLSVGAPIDFDALGAIEQHFGFDPAGVFTIESAEGEEVEYSLRGHLGDEVVDALAKHGILVEESAIRADFPWLVRQTAPYLQPLAEAVVAEWGRSMPAPRASKTPHPGNIMRSDGMIEALTSFVQRAVPYDSIPARLQDFERCGVRTPGPTLRRGADCDSKALLLAAMIRSINNRVPIVLVSLTVTGRPHMLIGVGVPARECDAILDYGGRRYVLIEVTSALGVGVMAPDYNDAVLEHYTVIP